MSSTRRPGSLFLLAIVALFVGSAISGRVGADVDLFALPFAPSSAKKGIKNANSMWKRTEAMQKNIHDCRAKGGTQQSCTLDAIRCDLTEQALSLYVDSLPGPGGWIVDKSKMLDIFKMSDCGDECYFCCLRTGLGDSIDPGCHTSFGPSPVVNCNDGYGPGSHTIGRALILQQPEPGTACLFVQQTCENYSECALAEAGSGYGSGAPPRKLDLFTPGPELGFGWVTPDATSDTLCHLGPDWQPPADEQSLLPDPKSPETNDYVMRQKARAFAESIARKVDAYLETLPADHPPDELHDLLSFRGCEFYGDLASVAPFNGVLDPFRAPSDASAVADSLASRRAMAFLATFRVLAGVPNLYERFAYVESKTWSCHEKDDYFRQAGIEDPDRELRKSMGPVALALLKAADGVQDYRLLSVPRPGESPVPANIRDGCIVGKPPRVTIAPRSADGSEYRLKVRVADGGTRSPISIDWGDGCTSAHEILEEDDGEATFGHVYAQTGNYRILAVAGSGRSGLRGVMGRVVEVTSADPAATCVPAYFRATLHQVEIFSQSPNDPGYAGLLLEQPVPDAAPDPLGRSEVVRLVSGSNGLGEVVAYNEEPIGARSLVIRPTLYGQGGSWDSRKLFIDLGDVTFDRFSPGSEPSVSQRVRLTAETVHAFYRDAPTTPVAATPVSGDPDGRLRVPLLPVTSSVPVDAAKQLDRIEIDLAALFDPIDLGIPTLDAGAVGRSRRWSEVAPNELVPIGGAGDDLGGGCACSLTNSGRRRPPSR